MNFYAELDADRERFLQPRRKLAHAIFARWQRHRAAKRYPLADLLLQRAQKVGYQFSFTRWGGPEIQFGFRLFWRFGSRRQRRRQQLAAE